MDHTNNSCHHKTSCHASKGKVDKILWGSLLSVLVLYLMHWQAAASIENIRWLKDLSFAIFHVMNSIWWGIALGIVMVSLLAKIPREFVIAVLGEGGGVKGVIRATLGGVLLDLCSHGILMVGSKLYERGASIGQVMAFLIASPWNSFSLTLILIALIGLPWTLAFIVLSMAIAIISGVIFDGLVKRGTLPENPNKIDLPKDFHFFKEAKKRLAATSFTGKFFVHMFIGGIKESRMVLRWIFFGVLLAGLVKASIDTESFQAYFGPSLIGLGITIFMATIIEVCSEGSTPIAADIFTRAAAPGNSFAFLMTGVSTDYTEIMILKDTTKSWKIALFLPLVTLPQIILIAWVMNGV